MASNKKVLTLFYDFRSYCSQRAFLTIEEKGLAFKKRMLMLDLKENLEPWYLDINIKGEVPAITHGDHSVPDSNQILDYLDKEFPESPRLQPDETTTIGKKVRQWRNQIGDLKIDIISFGSIRHRNELTRNALIPAASLRFVEGPAKNPNAEYESLMLKYPKYKEVYEKKIHKYRSLQEKVNDYDQVVSEIKTLDALLDETEKQLQETKSQSGSGEEHWFLGHTFTAADVYFAILLNRLKYLGLVHHLYGSKPLLTAYYERLHQREAFLKSCVNQPNAFTSKTNGTNLG
ncbi:ganglioside-induced differentiation-associated protein 1-like [Ptychodera flava]|uniref:ganglioside-induced differentiation-associated protein 1-like n=1 Tax=Ptychodera flava TaxID=63121 RepID=UPI003969FF49